MFQRLLKLPKNNSFFLFGPRGVGKSTLLRETFPPDTTHYIDLLDYDLEAQILQHPARFGQILSSLPETVDWVVVDEVQKLPFILDEVHRHIEGNRRRHFALTGSSARKLKRGKANLLAGRAFTRSLHPLTSVEIGSPFNLETALAFGTLPAAWTMSTDAERCDYLRTYAQTYLKEEIQMEGATRNLPGFRRFLPLAATANGEVLSWSNFANDAGVDAKTIRSYFEILEDTLVGTLLSAYRKSLRKRQKTHPKFYFFDPGVKRALANQLTVPLMPGSSDYGRAFEHFWVVELMRLCHYSTNDWSFSYLATHDVEIDLVIERPGKSPLLIEVKSSERVKDSDLGAILQISSEIPGAEALCISREPRRRRMGPVLVCPWQEVVAELKLLTEPSSIQPS